MHIPAPQVCVHTSRCPEGLPPHTHVIPLSLEEEEYEDEGTEGGGEVKVVSSYPYRGQLCKKKRKILPLLCTGPFVLYNQLSALKPLWPRFCLFCSNLLIVGARGSRLCQYFMRGSSPYEPRRGIYSTYQVSRIKRESLP